MEVNLRRVSGCKFEATNENGNTATLDGPPSVGGQDAGVRPMEMVLMGLAGCSAVDVLLILEKGRQEVEDLDIRVSAERVDAVPAVFSTIHLHFAASGAVDEKKLQRAVALTMKKYCSVATMLEKTAEITHSCSVKK